MKNKLQVLLIMSSKFTLYGIVLQLFFVASLWATELAAQETKSVKEVNLSIQVESRTILDIFRIIEQKTSFKFFYENKYIDRSLRYDFNDRSISVNDILLQISRDSNLKFKQINNTINVTTKDPAQPGGIAEVEIIIQTRTVSGKVTSFEDEEGIPGVNVIEKGTNNGTVTDINGDYSLEVSEGATVVFSSVGYTTEEAEIGNRTVVDMTLVQDITQLQELVVVGYGEQQYRDLTGSVASVDIEEMENL
ncbi:MAG: carboxypeptidase-like regulatory domain-containing protein, partial [Cyclobacteriaceae bacterium]